MNRRQKFRWFIKQLSIPLHFRSTFQIPGQPFLERLLFSCAIYHIFLLAPRNCYSSSMLFLNRVALGPIFCFLQYVAMGSSWDGAESIKHTIDKTSIKNDIVLLPVNGIGSNVCYRYSYFGTLQTHVHVYRRGTACCCRSVCCYTAAARHRSPATRGCSWYEQQMYVQELKKKKKTTPTI